MNRPWGCILWLTMALALGLPAACMPPVPLDQPSTIWPHLAQTWALHPDRGWQQPIWSWWTAAWLHGSFQHLYKNIAGLMLVATLGCSFQVSRTAALAWFMAWPLTQIGMVGQPFHTYIGLSGVLHAGVAILSIDEFRNRGISPKSWLGGMLLMGLAFKILMENPWQNELIRLPGSDITIAPWAHLSGAVAGAISLLFISVTSFALRLNRRARRPRTLI